MFFLFCYIVVWHDSYVLQGFSRSLHFSLSYLLVSVCLTYPRLCWTFFSLWSWYFWFLDVFVSGEGDKRIPHHKHSTVHFFIFWFQGVRLSCNFWSVLKQYCSSPGFLIVSKFFFGFWLLFYSLSVQSSDHLWREVSFVKPLNFDLLVIQA